jgi:hypothetical protein
MHDGHHLAPHYFRESQNWERGKGTVPKINFIFKLVFFYPECSDTVSKTKWSVAKRVWFCFNKSL